MKQIGQEILLKIQNLLTQCNKKSRVQFSKKQNNNQQYTLQRNNTLYSNNNKTNKKYDITKSKLHKKDTIQQDRIYQEEKQYQKFKVTNKKTVAILSKKNILPIYQRVEHILKKKQKFIKRQKNNKEKMFMESMMPQNNIKYPSKRFNSSEFSLYIEQIQQKNKQRIQKIHFNKIQKMNNQQKSTKTPQINQMSRSLSSKRYLAKNYSQNVYKRMQQYTVQRQMQKQNALKKRIQMQGGYRPSICPKSQKILQKIGRSTILSRHSHMLKCQSGCGTMNLSYSLTRNPSLYKKSLSNKSFLNKSTIITDPKKSSKSKATIKDFNIKYSPLRNTNIQMKSIKKIINYIDNHQQLKQFKQQKRVKDKKKDGKQNRSISPLKTINK